jgi:gliding motility-associated protein GldE
LEASLEEPPSLFLLQIITPLVIGYGVSIILLLILSALISGSEVAFFSLSNQDIIDMRKNPTESGKRTMILLQNPKRLLATILILNNLVNIAIVTLSTFLTWELVGTHSPEGVILIILTSSVTFAIVFFGEVMPKVFAVQNYLLFARITAPLLWISTRVLKPVAWVLMNLSGVIEKRFEKKGYSISVDELHQALEIATDKNTSDEEKEILKGIVNFGTLTVKQIMRSRLDITAVDEDCNFHELLDKINKSGYSRIPVFNETIDSISGVLYIKDLLPYIEEEENFEWQKLLRPGIFVPETKKIDSLLKDFQEKRVHMAIVVDEYGGTSGLVTLEDIIEEIIGEINDEFDEEDFIFHKLDEQTFVFEGKTSLNDFCKAIDVDVSVFDDIKGESESLGGLILEINSTLPQAGEKIYFDNFVFTIVAVDQKRIKRVRVFIKEKAREGKSTEFTD